MLHRRIARGHLPLPSPRLVRYMRAKFAHEAYGIINEVHGDTAVLSGLAPASPACLAVTQSGSVLLINDMFTDGRIRAAVVFGLPKPRERVIVFQQQANLSVHDGYLGRVIDSLGRSLDGSGALKPPSGSAGPTRRQALVSAGSGPGITDRRAPLTALFTGHKAIDAFYPFVRGQCTAMTGEPGAGKAALAADVMEHIARCNAVTASPSERVHCM
jgi:F0F1-type ATP synthase alpha subunit